MALSADVEYDTMGHTEILPMKVIDAEKLYKGAIVNIGTDGYVEMAADVASEVPLGVVKEQVDDSDGGGTTILDVEVETGIIKLAHSGAAQTDVGALFYATADDTLADSASNVGPLGLCVGYESGYLWIDTRIKALS